jgi:hypothetical protein
MIIQTVDFDAIKYTIGICYVIGAPISMRGKAIHDELKSRNITESNDSVSGEIVEHIDGY